MGKAKRHRIETADKARRYVEGPLRRLLGTTGRVTALDPAHAGWRSLIYFVDIEGQPRGVLRAEESWHRGMALLSNIRHLANRGIPCPTVLAADRSPLTFLRWGFLPIFEERIEGWHPYQMEDTESGIRSTAEALAALHNVCRNRWGSPRLPRWGSYRRHAIRRIERWARCILPHLGSEERAKLLPWFFARAGDCPFEPPFSLVHAAVRLTNFVVTPEGRTVLIDLAGLRYGSFARNVAWALKRVAKKAPDHVVAFRDAYFAAGPPERREAFERSERFFLAAYELSRLAIYSRRLRRSGRKSWPPEEAMRSIEIHVDELARETGLDLRLKPM